MNDTNLLDTVVSWLEKEKRQGRRRIRLTPEAKRALAAKPAVPARPAPVVVAKSAPAPAPAAARPVVSAVPPPRPAVQVQAGEGTGAPRGVVPRATPAATTVTPLHRPTATPVPDSPADVSPLDLSAHTLETLPAVVAACKRCRLCSLGRTQTVFADGSARSRVMFVGEGPGADEDAQGVPFVGAAGQLLTKMILAMKLKREDVYIANIVKCRPPDNRAPHEDEAQACLPYVQRQIELVKPVVIVVLGAVPFQHLLGRKGITAGRGRWYEYKGIPVMATYHPAFLLRTPGKKGEAWADLQLVMKHMGLM